MADLDFLKWDTAQIFEEIKQYYKQESNGEELEIGSNAFAIASAVSYILGCAKDRFNEMSKQRYLSTATGEYLTRLGETLGAPRPKEITHAKAFARIWSDYPLRLVKNVFVVEIDGAPFTTYETLDNVTDNIVLLIGCGDDAEKENSISTESVCKVVGGIETIGIPSRFVQTVDSVIQFDDLTPLGGAFDLTGDALENDALYRDYIRDNLATKSNNGSAASYIARAKWCDGNITSATVLQKDDPDYLAGHVQVFLGTRYDFAPEHAQALRVVVENELNDADWKPLGDVVTVSLSTPVSLDLGAILYVEQSYRGSFVSKFCKEFERVRNELKEQIGRTFYASDLLTRLMSQDADGTRIKDGNIFAFPPNSSGNAVTVYEINKTQHVALTGLMVEINIIDDNGHAVDHYTTAQFDEMVEAYYESQNGGGGES